MPTELHLKYRPKKFADVIGQDGSVKALEEKLRIKKVPHVIMFHGSSGCGKTTLARILRKEMGCSAHDFMEINAASARGIDTIREIESKVGLSPMNGTCRIWLLDESHQLSKRRGGDAQTALLKVLEDTPSHAYFFLCTTDPNDMLPTILNRCWKVKVSSLDIPLMTKLLSSVLLKEGKMIPGPVMEAIVEVADGSAREALQLLDKVLCLKTQEEQLSVIQSADTKRQAFDLAKALIWEKPDWKKICRIIEEIGEQEWEGIRHMVLTCAGKEVLKNNPRTVEKAFAILCAFENDWFSSKRNGLIRACFEVFHG